MESLINIATDSFISSSFAKLEDMLMNFFLDLTELLIQSLTGIFDLVIISDFVNMSVLLGRFLFGATLIILLIDIIEETGSWKSDQFKAIEWTTILFNLIKAALFAEFAPQAAVLGLRLVVDGMNSFDPTLYLTGMITNHFAVLFSILIAIIAAGGFFVVTGIRVAAILVQAFSAFLYVPDIVRGQTTSMGSWMRQTVSILLTFFLQYTAFFIGLTLCIEGELLYPLIMWTVMFCAGKFLDKYGMSTGVTGAVSGLSGMVHSSIRTVSAIVS